LTINTLGYDEGGFSASIGLPSFKTDFGLTPSLWKNDAAGLADRTANISSFGVLGAAFGSLVALALTDRIGRLRCWQLSIALWGSGILMQIFSSGILGLMLFARIWGGLGAGGLTVVAPLYLSEVAPAKSRGMVVSIYMVILLSFLSLGKRCSIEHDISLLIDAGFFVNYAANASMAPSSSQYRVVQAVPLLPVGIAFICSFYLSDTPRWLASKERGEEALAALARLRRSKKYDHEISDEYKEIQEQSQTQQQDLAGVSIWMIVKEIATTSTYRERFLLGVTMQSVAQWSGGNGITYYIPQVCIF
jgi:MFS family permease